MKFSSCALPLLDNYEKLLTMQEKKIATIHPHQSVFNEPPCLWELLTYSLKEFNHVGIDLVNGKEIVLVINFPPLPLPGSFFYPLQTTETSRNPKSLLG